MIFHTKPLWVQHHCKLGSMKQTDGFIKIHDGTRYLQIFSNSLYDKICDRIKYLISKKNGIADSINHSFERIRSDSYNS